MCPFFSSAMSSMELRVWSWQAIRFTSSQTHHVGKVLGQKIEGVRADSPCLATRLGATLWYLLSGLSCARTAGRALSEYGLGLHPPRFLVLSHVLAIPWSHLLCNSTLLVSDHLRHMLLRSDSGSERHARSLIETWAWLLQVRRAEPVDGHRASHGPANQSKRKQEKRRFQLLQLLVLVSARSFLPSYVRLARCAAWWSANKLHWASCPPGDAV